MADGVVALFAGIGGIELGLHRAGFETKLLVENDASAQAVLRHHFGEIALHGDIRDLPELPHSTILTAGFPCQDLSQAGKTAGISGRHSGLVENVFKLLANATIPPVWVVLENVPFMLQLDHGKAMRFLVQSLETLGYSWAYRVIDARAFGLPQRRQRVVLLASKSEDPREVLLHGSAAEPEAPDWRSVACGFYWTEGTKGLGWAVDAVPTLKGGSTLGIPSPPAILMPGMERIVTPDIRDAERLQGFDADWTLPAVSDGGKRNGPRWRLVGNAVSVPVAEWLGQRLRNPVPYDAGGDDLLRADSPWPKAAWGRAGEAYRAGLTLWPAKRPYHHLAEFLAHETAPLSARGTSGFLSRICSSQLKFPSGFKRAVARHLKRMVYSRVSA
jgi:DNA (cytosine-5)-methyltransferase 1